MEKIVCFKNAKGYGLSGTILLPAGTPPYPAVVFSHGRYSGKFSPRSMEVARALEKQGIASFLIDFTGHGESDGTMNESTLEQQLDDLGAAIDYLAQLDEIDAERIGVNGAGTGSGVAVLRAANDPRIKVLVLRSSTAEAAIKAAYLVSVPTLIIAGERDQTVVEESQALYTALSGEKRLELIRGAGSLFERPEHLNHMVELSVNWFVEKHRSSGIARAA